MKRYLISGCILALIVSVAGYFFTLPTPKSHETVGIEMPPVPSVTMANPKSVAESLEAQVANLEQGLKASERNIEAMKESLKQQTDLLNKIEVIEQEHSSGKLTPDEYLRERERLHAEILSKT